MQLICHPFIKKYETVNVDLSEYVRSIVDFTQRLKDIADVSSFFFFFVYFFFLTKFLISSILTFLFYIWLMFVCKFL